MNERELQNFIENMNAFSREQLVTFDQNELVDRKICQDHFHVFSVTFEMSSEVNFVAKT
ncbi:hypothetical protein D3C72_2567000 [compost metagenome]